MDILASHIGSVAVSRQPLVLGASALLEYITFSEWARADRRHAHRRMQLLFTGTYPPDSL